MIDTPLRIIIHFTSVINPIAHIAALALMIRAYRVRTPQAAALAALAGTVAATTSAITAAYLAARHNWWAVGSALVVALDLGTAIGWRSIAIRRREAIYNALRHRADQTQGDLR